MVDPVPIILHHTPDDDHQPALLYAGEAAVCVGPTFTKLWVGDGAVNRLLLSNDPAENPLITGGAGGDEPIGSGVFGRTSAAAWEGVLPLAGGTLDTVNGTAGVGLTINNTSVAHPGITVAQSGSAAGIAVTNSAGTGISVTMSGATSSGITAINGGTASNQSAGFFYNSTTTTPGNALRVSGLNGTGLLISATGSNPAINLTHGFVRIGDVTGPAITTDGSLNVSDGFYINGIKQGAGGATISTTAPASPVDGQFWWDPGIARLFLYSDNEQWIGVSAPAGGGGGGNFLPLVGGDLTGPLGIATNAVTDLLSVEAYTRPLLTANYYGVRIGAGVLTVGEAQPGTAGGVNGVIMVNSTPNMDAQIRFRNQNTPLWALGVQNTSNSFGIRRDALWFLEFANDTTGNATFRGDISAFGGATVGQLYSTDLGGRNGGNIIARRDLYPSLTVHQGNDTGGSLAVGMSMRGGVFYISRMTAAGAYSAPWFASCTMDGNWYFNGDVYADRDLHCLGFLETHSYLEVGSNITLANGNIFNPNGSMYFGTTTANPASASMAILDGRPGYSFFQMRSGHGWQCNHSNNAWFYQYASNAWMQAAPASNAITNNWGTFVSSSDPRLKREIAPSSYGADAVKAIRPIRFRRVAIRSLEDETVPLTEPEVGFNAREVMAVVPEATAVLDDPLHPGTNDPTIGINPLGLVAVLWRTVQELLERIEQLEAA